MSLSPLEIRKAVRQALDEDLGAGDLTAAAILAGGNPSARGTILAREPLVVCGVPFASAAFRSLDRRARVEVRLPDGSDAKEGDEILRVEGMAGAILTAERTALNFLQHLSAIATKSRDYARAVADLPVTVLDTRKTIPGLRVAEKYAVRTGGSSNHRFRLDDGILVKNNHISLAGGVRAALERVAAGRSPFRPIEIEVRSLDELREAIATGIPAIVMLDNFTPEGVRAAVAVAGGKVTFEVSGGITGENLRAYAEALGTGGGCISAGSLTHTVRAADLALRIEPLP